jgi:uncharacterized membrane protein YraQ (UPF0718 family)
MDYALQFFLELWALTLEMAPYLLLGFGVAGILRVFVAPETIRHHLGERGFGQVFKATALGVPLPLCSCGVLPLATGLRKQGASKGATTAVLASTPQTGADSILATAAMLGWPLSILRAVVAFLSGLASGWGVDRFVKDTQPLEDVQEGGRGAEVAKPSAETQPVRVRIMTAARYAFITLPEDLSRSVIIGLAVAAAVVVFLPPQALEPLAQVPGLAYLAVTLIALPMYVCSVGSIPVAFALVAQGLSPGAGLIFLIAGPATNSVNIVAVYRLLGKKALAIFLATMLVLAWLSGWLFDVLAPRAWVDAEEAHREMLPQWLAFAAAVLMLGLFAWVESRELLARVRSGIWGKDSQQEGGSNSASATEREPDFCARVEGMECPSCASKIRSSLARAFALERLDLDSETGDLRLWSRKPAPASDEVASVVRKAGYRLG